MTKDELIKSLKEANREFKHDPECAHLKADDLLIAFIGDEDIKAAYNKIQPKWYA